MFRPFFVIVFGLFWYGLGQHYICDESSLSVGYSCTKTGTIVNETTIDYNLPLVSAHSEFELIVTLTVLKGAAELAVGEMVYLNTVEEHKSFKTNTKKTKFARVSKKDFEDHPGDWIARVTTITPNVIYMLMVQVTNSSISLIEQQRQVIENIAHKCCKKDNQNECKLLKKVSGGNSGVDLCHSPPNFCNFEGELEVLDLTHFYLHCELPAELAQISTIKVLVLPSVRSGQASTLGEIVKSMSGLESLKMENSKIEGNLSCDLAGDNLKLLDLSKNQISGSIPGCILNMPKLEYLDFVENQLSGELPGVVEGNQIRYLLLGKQSVGISGQIPSMRNASQLEFLFIDHNLLVGTLPQLPQSIREINLMNNSIKGGIPNSYIELRSLEAFEVSNNRLSGRIPDFVATMEQVEVLDMANNSLRGTIPHNWSTPNLKQLQLGGNKLYGVLPMSLGQLAGVLIVSAPRNGLSGTLDSYARGLSDNNSVLGFDVSNNNFDGDIPGELSKLSLFRKDFVLDRGPNFFYVENNNFDGEIPLFLMKAMLNTNHTQVKVQGNYFGCPESIPDELRSAQLNELQCHGSDKYTMIVVADLPSTPNTTQQSSEQQSSEQQIEESSSVGMGLVLLICFLGFGVILLSAISFFACRMYQKRKRQYYILYQNSVGEKQTLEGISMDSQSCPPETIKQIALQEQTRNSGNQSFQFNGKQS